MAHTVFKTSVPYNNIKLAGDTHQWANSEQTSADQAFAYGGNVRMSDLQRASGTNIDPNDGVVSVGGLADRYGISVLGDVSAGDGVYTYQVGGTNSNFIDTRSYNMAGSPSNIRLGRFTSWDYTAVADGIDADAKRMSFLTGTCRLNLAPVQIYKDFPGYIMDASNNTNYNLLVRSSPFGDKFSSNAVNNRAISGRSSNFVGGELHIPLYDTAPKVGTTRQAVLGTGRSSSSTSFYRVALHNVTINSNGTMTLAYSNQNAGNFNFGTTNCAPHWGSYINDNTVVVYIGRGNSSHKIARITVSGTTATNTHLVTVGSGTTYGAGSGQVASTHNNFGATKYTFMIKGDTRSSFNNFVKIQAFNTTSGLTSLGSLTTLVTSTNNVKTARMAILATTADYIYFLHGYSNASGDVVLQTTRFNISNNTYTNLGSSVTHTFNDTNLIQHFNIETLTAVKKTAIQKFLEDFIPGQSNAFSDRVYWTMVVSTPINGDPVDTVYGYFDITSNVLSVIDTARTYGRQAYLTVNHFMQENTGFLSGANTRSNAGLPWRLRFGGRSASAGANPGELAVAGHSLDKVLDWSNGADTDPGSNVFDITGDLFTENVRWDNPSGEPDWGQKGVWRVANAGNAVASYAVDRYQGTTLSSNASTGGTSLNAVGANTWGVWLHEFDDAGNNWDDFLMNQVRGRLQNGQNVGMSIQTNNANLIANFTLTPSNVTVTRNAGITENYIAISYAPGVNWSHQGNSWSFINNYAQSGAKFAVVFTQI